MMFSCSLPLSAALAVAAAPDAPRAIEGTTAPVVVDGETLFQVRGISAAPADQRARGIAERIEAVAADPAVSPESLRVVEVEGRSDIMSGDIRVATMVDADARLEDVRRQTLAAANLARIRAAIETYRRDRSPEALRRSAAYSGAATAALLLSILVVIHLGRRFGRALDRRLERRVQSIAIQSFQIVQAERIFAALHGVLRAVRAVTIFTFVIVWMSYVLERFPWTRAAGRALVRMVTGPLVTLGYGLLAILPDLVFLTILTVLTRYVLGLLFLFFDAIDRGTVKLGTFEREWAWPTHRVVRVVVVVFAIVVAFPYIPGSESDAFRGISIFLGIVFSLGSSSVVANVIAGYSMIYRRTFKSGDRVRIGEHVGDVTEIRLQVTHLRSPKNEEIIVPNSQILTSEVVNYSSYARQGKLILHTTIGIGYEVPWRQVEAMLLLAAARTEGILHEPPPFVLQRQLADFAVTYELNAYCNDAQSMMRLYSSLHRNILDLFNEYGVQIMTPAYEGDPERPKVVPKDQWFAAPARKE
jgi:small-conductance mechanosensitive channel